MTSKKKNTRMSSVEKFVQEFSQIDPHDFRRKAKSIINRTYGKGMLYLWGSQRRIVVEAVRQWAGDDRIRLKNALDFFRQYPATSFIGTDLTWIIRAGMEMGLFGMVVELLSNDPPFQLSLKPLESWRPPQDFNPHALRRFKDLVRKGRFGDFDAKNLERPSRDEDDMYL